MDWIHKILRAVDHAMDVSAPIKRVACLPQVSVDSHTMSDILLDYRDEGGRVLLRNGDQKHFCLSLSRCHPVPVYCGTLYFHQPNLALSISLIHVLIFDK